MADGELVPLRREKEILRGMEMLNVLNLSGSIKGVLRQLYKPCIQGDCNI